MVELMEDNGTNHITHIERTHTCAPVHTDNPTFLFNYQPLQHASHMPLGS